jgi:hypothetical protein
MIVSRFYFCCAASFVEADGIDGPAVEAPLQADELEEGVLKKKNPARIRTSSAAAAPAITVMFVFTDFP